MGLSITNLWMRSVRFTTLRDLLALVAQSAPGLYATEMERLLRRESSFAGQRGKPPSRTTIYHCRNTLVHLGIIVRRGRRYVPNYENTLVRELLAVLRPGAPNLSPEERLLFSQLVIANEDCQRAFFDLFMSLPDSYGLEDFLSFGQRVAWKSFLEAGNRWVLLYNLDDSNRQQWLKTEAEFQAVLYGVRYWARNELGFLDEIFLEDLGGVMFPVEAEGPVPEPRIVSALAESINGKTEWTVLSVRDVAFRWAPRFRVPLSRVFATLSAVRKAYPEFVVVIPTSEAFATITAQTPAAEAYQLRSYLQEAGRYVSHIRVHRKLKEVLRWEIPTRV